MARSRSLMAICFFFCLSWSNAQQSTLHLFFTGDINGVVKADYPDFRGDILRIQAAMDGLRDREGISRAESLLLDTGDALAYNYHSQLDSGRTVFRTMAAAGFDAMVAGNMDLLYGIEHFQALNASDSSFSVLCANLFQDDSTLLFAPYRIFQRSGLKIAVIGLTEAALKQKKVAQQLQNLKAEAGEEHLEALVVELKAQSDIIIALTHLTMDENLELCRKIPGIDLAISKSSQDSLQLLQLYDARSQANTTIVQAPAYARSIGRLDVRVSAGRKPNVEVLRRPPADVVPLTFDTIDLKDYQLLEEKFIAHTTQKYNGYIPDFEVTQLKEDPENELLDVALFSMLRSTNSEIAFLNRGALYQPKVKQTGGRISVRDIEGVTRPFDPIYTMRLNGKQIKAILNRNRQFGEQDDASLRFMAVNSYPGLASEGLQPHGLPLNDDEVYAVTTNRYLALGGDGYTEFTKGTHQRWEFEGTTLLVASRQPEARNVFLNELLIQYFTTGKYPKNADPAEFFRHASFINRPLWLLRFENVDFSFKSVSVNNNENFENANDKRVDAGTENAVYLATAGYISAIRRTPRTRWENGVLFRYALQDIGDQDLQESDDKIELQTILDWRDPFGLYKDPKKMNLYSSVRFDTEFSPGTDSEGQRVARRQDLYLYFGISRFGQQSREARIALFGKDDLSTGKISAGIEANMKYFKSFRFFKHGSILRARYLFDQPNRRIGEEKASLDFTTYFEFSLLEFINLKPQINWFVFQDILLKEVATNLQFSVNLSFTKLWKPQYLRFLRRDVL